MRKKLRNLVAGLGITLMSLLPFRYANAQSDSLNAPLSIDRAGNFFSPSGVNELVGKPWRYGDGDINHDGKTDSLDLEVAYLSNDQRDVDGDGICTQMDNFLLAQYLNGSISHLPGDWKNLNKEEKISWIEKMVKIDKTNEINPLDSLTYGWVCRNFVTQAQINFYGSSDIDEFIQSYHNDGEPLGGGYYFGEKNARFGLPVTSVTTTSTGGIAHAVNGILVGEDPLNFDDWYFWDVYSDKRSFPGDDAMDPNRPVSIGLNGYFRGVFEDFYGYIRNLIIFFLNNGQVVNTFHKDYVTLYNPEKIKVELGSLEKIVLDNNQFPDVIDFTPEFLKSKGYKAIPDTSSENAHGIPIKLVYADGDTTYLGPDWRHFQFLRKFTGSIYSGGITKSDTSSQIIEINNFTDIGDEDSPVPRDFKLYQNYPNPFNPTTTIRYELPEYTPKFAVEIYNSMGELVKILNGERSAGVHEIKWDGRNEFNQKVPSGIYLYKVVGVDKPQSRKMVLQK